MIDFKNNFQSTVVVLIYNERRKLDVINCPCSTNVLCNEFAADLKVGNHAKLLKMIDMIKTIIMSSINDYSSVECDSFSIPTLPYHFSFFILVFLCTKIM